MNWSGSKTLVLVCCGVLFACDDAPMRRLLDFPVPDASVAGSAGRGAAGSPARPPSKMDAGMGTKAPPKSGDKPRPTTDNDAGTDDDGGIVATPTKTRAARAGHWIGTTSQSGRQIEFDLTPAGLTEVRLSWGGFGCDGDNKTPISPPEPLDDTFSVSFPLAGSTVATLEGTFDGDDRVAGTLEYETPGAGALSCGAGRATWSAERQVTAPAGDRAP